MRESLPAEDINKKEPKSVFSKRGSDLTAHPKEIKMKKILCLTVAVILMLSVFSGCGEDATSSIVEATDSSSTVSSVPETPEDPKGTADPTLYNPITGKYDLASPLSTYPVAVMICNDAYTKSQPGIHTADMYVETETEGGISRIMAIYADATRTPSLLGPVRSGRTPFIQITRALGMVYVHAGGSPKALQMVQQKDVHNINALGSGIATVRDAEMKRSNANKFDHCLGVENAGVVKAMEKAKFNKSYEYNSPWDYSKGNITAGDDAVNIEIKMSAQKTGNSFFTYDAEKGIYLKDRGTASSHKPHKSTSGEQIEVANIVILFADKFVEQREDYTRINFDLEEGGETYVFTQGKKLTGKYSYTKDGFTLLDADGNKMNVSTGKTYLYIMSNKYKNQVTVIDSTAK